MTEVSNLHRHRLPPPALRRSVPTTLGSHLEDAVPEAEEFYNPLVFGFNSFSPPINSSNPSFFDDYATSFDLGFDLNSEPENVGCEYEDPNCFFIGGEEEDDRMNYVTDLFESRQLSDDLVSELDSSRVEEPDMEFGFGPGLGSNMGLRVGGMDSESDSEQFEVSGGFFNDDDDDNYNVFGIRDQRYSEGENGSEVFEWEEVGERIQNDERENLNLVIDGMEEISVSSDISSSDIENSTLAENGGGAEVGRNREWEFLLAVNNLERNLEYESAEDDSISEGEIRHINLPEDYILTMEYDAVFGQLVENDNASKGSPPAAKSVVENLASLVLTKEDVKENNSMVCAVCKDEFSIGEKVKRLPCGHLYHGECILTWLGIRNTCPVCRHELPTDDADYEKRKDGRDQGGSSGSLFDDFEVRYNFDLLP